MAEESMEKEIMNLANQVAEKVTIDAKNVLNTLEKEETITFKITFKLEEVTDSYKASAEKVSVSQIKNRITAAAQRALNTKKPGHDSGNIIVSLEYEYVPYNIYKTEKSSGGYVKII